MNSNISNLILNWWKFNIGLSWSWDCSNDGDYLWRMFWATLKDIFLISFIGCCECIISVSDRVGFVSGNPWWKTFCKKCSGASCQVSFWQIEQIKLLNSYVWLVLFNMVWVADWTSFWFLVIPGNVNFECQVTSPHTTQSLCTAVTANGNSNYSNFKKDYDCEIKAVENDSS